MLFKTFRQGLFFVTSNGKVALVFKYYVCICTYVYKTHFSNTGSKTLYQCNSGQNGSKFGGPNQMSHEVLKTRRQSIFNFFCKSRQRRASEGRCWLVQDAEARFCLDLQKNLKCLAFWLSGLHGTSNFDHLFLIHSDLNYTTLQGSQPCRRPVPVIPNFGHDQ